MDRNKLLAIVVGAMAASAVVVFGVGNAQAATWHDYEGDIYAGHAYGLQVPAKAEGFEIVLEGAEASASLAVFDPSGSRLGYYALDGSLTAASIAAPAAGRHVLYVYELSEGSLHVRVNAKDAPALDLQQIPLARQDVAIGSQESSAKLDKVFSAKLEAAPVFVTLLYEGSAKGLDATVASVKGDVVTISDESGTAFSPGVWTSVTGTRASEPANLEGVAYTVTAHAERFEGRLVLTALSLDLKAGPALAPPATVKPAVHAKHPTLPIHDMAGVFAVPEGNAIAFVADAKGQLFLEAAKKADDERGRDAWIHDLVAVYAPDDTLVAFVELTAKEPNATIDLPVGGEYVAYAYDTTSKAVLARIVGANLVHVRPLALANETLTLDVESRLDSSEQTLALAHAPVRLALRIDEDAFGVLGSVTLENDLGHVADAMMLASAGANEQLQWDGGVYPENFASGEHTLRVHGILEGKVVIEAVHYVRGATLALAPTPPTPPVDAEEPEEPEAPEEPEDPSGMGIPLPPPPAVMDLLPDL